jgi:hypothetical protein
MNWNDESLVSLLGLTKPINKGMKACNVARKKWMKKLVIFEFSSQRQINTIFFIIKTKGYKGNN